MVASSSRCLLLTLTRREAAAIQLVHRRVNAARGKGRRRFCSPTEKVPEKVDGVGDIQLSVIGGIRALQAPRFLASAKKIPQDKDCIRDSVPPRRHCRRHAGTSSRPPNRNRIHTPPYRTLLRRDADTR